MVKGRGLGETKLAADIKVTTTQNICRIYSTAVYRQVLHSLMEITAQYCKIYGWNAAHMLISCSIRLQRSWVEGCCIFHAIILYFFNSVLAHFHHFLIHFVQSGSSVNGLSCHPGKKKEKKTAFQHQKCDQWLRQLRSTVSMHVFAKVSQ